MITDVNDKEIYEQAKRAYTLESQIRKLWEECTELGLACAHTLDRGYNANLIEEIADVENMLEQIKHYFDDWFRETIDSIRLEKLNRVDQRIHKGEHLYDKS